MCEMTILFVMVVERHQSNEQNRWLMDNRIRNLQKTDKRVRSKNRLYNSHEAVQDATVHLLTVCLCDGLQSCLYNCTSHQHDMLINNETVPKMR